MTNEVNCVEKCSHICNTTYFLLAVRKLDTTLTLLEAEGSGYEMLGEFIW